LPHAKDAKSAKGKGSKISFLCVGIVLRESSCAMLSNKTMLCCMNKDCKNNHTENEISKIILDAAFRVHSTTGPGLLETVYESILAYELRKHGLHVERQVPIPIRYDGIQFDEGFRADLLVEGKVIVELKSIEELARVHSKQVLTQLRCSGHRLGLLINFGEVQLKNGIERVVNGLPEESVYLPLRS
jgi:GxxExxY protein